MAESIREWLDNEVKAGYGAKFASAFEEVGVEDKSDLHDMDDELMKTLEAELQAVDAKPMHLTKIRKAIEAIVAPASATRAKLNAARVADLQMTETAESSAVVSAKEKRKRSRKKYAVSRPPRLSAFHLGPSRLSVFHLGPSHHPRH